MKGKKRFSKANTKLLALENSIFKNVIQTMARQSGKQTSNIELSSAQLLFMNWMLVAWQGQYY